MPTTMILRERLLRTWSPPAPIAAPVPAPAVVLLRPPYRPEGLRTADPELSEREEVPGTVVGVQLRSVLVDVEPVRAVLDELARRAPTCPAVVFLDTSGEQALSMFARLATLPARAVVPVGPSLPSDLRATLTDPTPLPAGVVSWIRSRGVRLNAGQADVDRAGAAEGARPRLGGCAAAGRADRALQRPLPPPQAAAAVAGPVVPARAGAAHRTRAAGSPGDPARPRGRAPRLRRPLRARASAAPELPDRLARDPRYSRVGVDDPNTIDTLRFTARIAFTGRRSADASRRRHDAQDP